MMLSAADDNVSEHLSKLLNQLTKRRLRPNREREKMMLADDIKFLSLPFVGLARCRRRPFFPFQYSYLKLPKFWVIQLNFSRACAVPFTSAFMGIISIIAFTHCT
jgi:hypothetical protein